MSAPVLEQVVEVPANPWQRMHQLLSARRRTLSRMWLRRRLPSEPPSHPAQAERDRGDPEQECRSEHHSHSCRDRDDPPPGRFTFHISPPSDQRAPSM